MIGNWLVFFVLLCFLAFAVNAQTSSGTIEGRALDPNGAPISRAQIKLTLTDSKTIEIPQSFVTDDSGEFKFENLPFGRYELEMKVSWSEAIFKRRVEVKSGDLTQTRVSVNLMIESCSGEFAGNSVSLADADKAEIIRQMLRLFDEKHSDLLMRGQRQSNLILSTENIRSELLTARYRQIFKLMRKADIQNRADAQSDFPYLKFSQLSVKGRCVEVSLDNIWAVGKKSQAVYMSGGGVTYEFRKIDGRWSGKLVTSRIS